MNDQGITRRQALQAAAVFFVGTGLSGCRSGRREMNKGQAPARGWEVIASGDDGPGPRSRHGLVYDRSAKAARTNLYCDIRKGATDVHVGELVESLRRLREIMRNA